ncbi:PREDICTED: microfibrillar-associated protein 1-like [Priapulus caudatus]|uniref:Microfibrillar-associated protein 1-like n=1 Tax=Priapulus caudatus TaxID=37621 RepID=A0ABM1E517_PRICU|nr:PREDICTED: microfibrillar-associated protein 1-like [Priapulus caudatus]
MEKLPAGPTPIQSTAGAVAVRNDKGEFVMQKVKVSRYVSGKRPEYAGGSSSEDEQDEDFVIQKVREHIPSGDEEDEKEKDDPRLRRLKQQHIDREERVERHRHIHRPEVLARSSDEDEEEEERVVHRHRPDDESSEDDDEEELDEEELERRRRMLRERAKEKQKEEELMDVEEEKSGEESAHESSEYEEYSDSEDESAPRLKPVFVRKRDRITIQEKEREAQKQKELEAEAKKMGEDRRRQTIKIVEDEARKELMAEKDLKSAVALVNTDDENDEAEYEAWKVRELKRIKRDKDEREANEREKLEVERYHNMTEEERRAELRMNPKVVTNKATKGKYKFLQKYFHRGAFYLDEEDTVLKQDFSSATLEDHFDKTILPKVMQVKNFGRSGRTKYTHLVDQDTTQFDAPWTADTTQNLKFQAAHAGGMKQSFEKPSLKKRKKQQP